MLKNMISEMVGAFTLLFVGMLAIANNVGLLGIALAHGLTVTILVMALESISGGQFNPAVSIGLSFGGYQDWRTTLMYIPAQLMGAALGGLAALGVAYEQLKQVDFAGGAIAQSTSLHSALLAETLTTFFLVLVVMCTAVHKKNPLAGFFIGLTVTIGILAVGPISGGIQNPARAFGSAIVGGGFTHHWIWWVGPIAGGILGVVVARLMQKKEEIVGTMDRITDSGSVK